MAKRGSTKEPPEFGKKVCALRKEQGLTQADLAAQIGVSDKMIDYYERRAVNIKSDIVKKLAEALKISTDELLGVKQPKKTGRVSQLERRLELVRQLPKKDQQYIVETIDRVLGNSQQKAS